MKTSLPPSEHLRLVVLRDDHPLLWTLVAVVLSATLGWLIGEAIGAWEVPLSIAGAVGFLVVRRMFRPKPRELIVDNRQQKLSDGRRAPWMRIDHSSPAISWNPTSSEERALVRKVLHAHHGSPWGYAYCFDRLFEGTNTRNYRAIGLNGQAYFVRLHVGLLDRGEIKRCQDVARFVADAKTFDLQYAHGVVALPNRHGETIVDLSESYPEQHDPLRARAPAKILWAELFPYLHGLTHYNGARPAQLRSYAQRLGVLQTQLRSCSLPAVMRNGDDAFVQDVDALQDGFDVLDRAAALAQRSGRGDFAVEMWGDNKAAVQEALSAVGNRLAGWDESKLPLLDDPHPHNCFFHNDECVLIYDYARFGQFRHTEVLAYAVHRFVREVIVADELLTGRSASHKVPELIAQFLDAYQDGGPEVSSDIRVLLPDLIRAAALRKYLSIMKKLLLVTSWDNEHRGAEELRSEGHKFAGFLSEAESFQG